MPESHFNKGSLTALVVVTGSTPNMMDMGPEREISDLTKATVVSVPKSAKSSTHSAPKSAKSVGQGSVITDQSRNEGAATNVEVDGGKRRVESGKDSAQGSSRTVRTQSRSSTPQYLQPPDIDTRPEQMVLKSDEAMVDLRKRDREALKGSSHAQKMVGKRPSRTKWWVAGQRSQNLGQRSTIQNINH